MHRSLHRSTPRRGRIVIGLIAITMVGGVALLSGAAGKGLPAAAPVASDTPASGDDQPVAMAAQINARLGLTRSELVRVDTTGLTAGEPGQTVMKIRDRLYTMNLEVHSVRAAGYRLFIQNGDDEKVEIAPGPVNTYRGTLAEAPGAVVSAGLMSDGLHGHVRFADGETWWFEGLAERMGGDPAFAGLHVVYNDADVIPSEGDCGTPHAPLALAQNDLELAQLPRTAQSSGGGPRVCEVACDADERFIDRWTSQSENRINTVMNAVNDQYLRDVDILHEIVAIVLHTTDPAAYTSNDPSTLLTQFRLHWIDEHTDIQRDVAHLFTGRDLSGTVIGIAWLGVICDSPLNGLGFGLVQSDCCGSLACASDLSAHELGHNWNAEHCSCPSNTMNPSLQCARQFSPTSTIPTILDFAASRSCLSDVSPLNNACDEPTVVADGTFAFTTIGSTTDGGVTDCGVISKDIWFQYTASCDGVATASTCGSDFDTRLAVYAAGDCGGTAFACNDDACDVQSSVEWFVTEGTSYLVRVGGKSQEGTGTLMLSCVPGPGCPDADGDGAVGYGDVLQILVAWGDAGGPADVDGSGTVGYGDILAVLADWGVDCP